MPSNATANVAAVTRANVTRKQALDECENYATWWLYKHNEGSLQTMERLLVILAHIDALRKHEPNDGRL